MRRLERLSDLRAGIIMLPSSSTKPLSQAKTHQQASVFKCIGQHIVPCLTFILRPHRIVRKQYQTPFQIFKSHISLVLNFPSSLLNIETNRKILILSAVFRQHSHSNALTNPFSWSGIFLQYFFTASPASSTPIFTTIPLYLPIAALILCWSYSLI